MPDTRHDVLRKTGNHEEDWAPVAEDFTLRPRGVPPRPTKVMAERSDTRHNAEVVFLETRIAEITRQLKSRDMELSATQTALTKARAQAAVLSEELRKRGGTKHYSNLTVKLGVAEAEIRSLAARKTQLAVRLAHVERERDKALQGQAIAEATLHKRCGTAFATITGKSKQPRQPVWQTSYQEHHQHPPLDRVGIRFMQNSPKNGAASEECAPNDTPADVGTRGGGMGTVASTVGPAGIGRGRPASDEYFSACVSGKEHDPQISRETTASPDERKIDGTSEKSGTEPFDDALDRGRRHLVPVGSRGLGAPVVVSKRRKGGAALAVALEKARASERRCVALVAATSRELENKRRETQSLRDTLHRVEANHNRAVAGGDYVETETRTENEREKEATEGSRGDGDRLHPVLEEGRGSMLQAVSATVYGLLDPTHDVWSVRRVTIFASFGVVLAAAATAGMLLFRTLLCGRC